MEGGVGCELGGGDVASGQRLVVCLVFIGGGDRVEPWEGAAADWKICDAWLERGREEGWMERGGGPALDVINGRGFNEKGGR